MSGIASSPGPFAFAFALVLLRSKPNGVSIEDFVLALRKSSSPIPNRSSSESISFNQSKLWQDLFHLSQQSNLYLRGTIASIRRESSQEAEHIDSNNKVIGRKRKLPNDSRADSKTSSRLKRQRSSPSSGMVTESHSNCEEAQHNDRRLILQIVFQLNRMIQDPPSNPADITSAISTACDAVLQISKNAQSTTVADKSGRSQVPTLNEACQAAERVWCAIIANLEAKKDNSCARLYLVPLAIPVSSILRSLLGQLHQHCVREAEQRHNKSSNFASAKIANLGRLSENTPNQIELFEHNTKAITRSLVYIISTAPKLNTKNQEIFDAVSGVLLQYIGESIAFHLFGPSSNGCTIGHAVPIPGVSKVLGTGVSHAKSAARIEAPYLVEILRTFVQKFVPEDLGCTSFKVFKAFQKTLLQGVFGSEDEQNPFPTYSGELMDPNTIENPDIELAYDGDGEDWFLTQVWELLGWDILIG